MTHETKSTLKDTASQLKNVDVKIEPLVPTNQLLNLIPTFSENTHNLNLFMKQCRYAKSLACGFQNNILLPYILGRLEGKASSFANRRDFDDLEHFLDEIQKQFGKNRSISEILLETQHARQKGSVMRFVEYFDNLRNELLSNTELVNDKSGILTKEYDKLLMNNFLIGLEPQFYNKVRICRPSNIDDAFKFALEEERALDFYNKHHKRYSEPNISNKSRVYDRSFNKINNYDKPNKSDSINPNITAKTNSVNRFCSHCNIKGHTIEYCRKLKSNSSEKYKNNNTSQDKKINSLNLETEDVTEQSSSEDNDEEAEMLVNLLDV